MLRLFHVKLSDKEKQAEVRYKHSIYKILVYSLCQDLLPCFLGFPVRNPCSLHTFNLKFRFKFKTDSSLLTKT